MYVDKGRGHMADFIYGKREIFVEKATYLPKNKSILHHQGIKYIGDPKMEWHFTTSFKESRIRYSHPVVLDAFWAAFWNLVKFGSKFGSEFDYRDKNVTYKK